MTDLSCTIFPPLSLINIPGQNSVLEWMAEAKQELFISTRGYTKAETLVDFVYAETIQFYRSFLRVAAEYSN